MQVGYLTAAVLSGLTMTMLWLFAGGGWLSSFLVYVLSGNLILAGLILRVVLRKDTPDATPPPHDEEPDATKA